MSARHSSHVAHHRGAGSMLIVSLHTLDTIGGGEAYTLNTALSVARSGRPVILISPVDNPVSQRDLMDHRMDTRWILVRMEGDAAEESVVVRFSDVLQEVVSSGCIWVHQYLGCPLFFDIAGNVAPDQTLLMTSLGYENERGLFPQLYQPSPNHWFVEISPYALERARLPGARWAITLGTGIWAKSIRCPEPPSRPVVPPPSLPEPLNVCAVGRVMPHKAFEVTIQGLPDFARLRLVGPHRDDDYFRLLETLPQAGQVTFEGEVSEETKWQILDASDVLVASSAFELHTGVVIDQPELLGLVLLEAVARHVLPVASDIPPFREIMTALGLEDLIYPQRDSGALRRLLESETVCQPALRHGRVRQAQTRLEQKYLWDTYWSRVAEAVGEASSTQEEITPEIELVPALAQPHGAHHPLIV